MAKITRKIAKIFGSSAGVNEIAEFGSLAAGLPVFTTDPTVIQSLSNYLEGWFAAVIGSNSPAIEDMNALFYLFAYQIAYLMQEGVAEYDATTTYYIGSLVSDGTGIVYVSQTNTNLGNALTDSTKWFAPVQAGMLTPNTLPYSAGMTLPASKSLMWPNLAIGNGQTVTVPNSANLIGVTSIVVSGTGVLVATGTGVIRVI